MKMVTKFYIVKCWNFTIQNLKRICYFSEEGAQSDDDDMIELIPMINEPDESGDGGKLVPIETDEEWDMIEEVVNTNMEE